MIVFFGLLEDGRDFFVFLVQCFLFEYIGSYSKKNEGVKFLFFFFLGYIYNNVVCWFDVDCKFFCLLGIWI